MLFARQYRCRIQLREWSFLLLGCCNVTTRWRSRSSSWRSSSTSLKQTISPSSSKKIQYIIASSDPDYVGILAVALGLLSSWTGTWNWSSVAVTVLLLLVGDKCPWINLTFLLLLVVVFLKTNTPLLLLAVFFFLCALLLPVFLLLLLVGIALLPLPLLLCLHCCRFCFVLLSLSSCCIVLLVHRYYILTDVFI